MRNAGPQDAQTVPVHVQIVDMEANALDMILPDYLPASDLTQRVARDAGLGAYWPDGSRRIFYLRARGRLMQPEERLKDLGVVPYELLHLLPEPVPGSGVEERVPEYPPNSGYAGAGNLNIALGLCMILAWGGGWALALTMSQGIIVGVFPAVGLSLLCTSFARHLWGGLGSSTRIPVTGFVLFVSLMVLSTLPTLIVQREYRSLSLVLGLSFISGSFGILLAWLAWYGAVEPLPKVTRKEVVDAVANVTYPCGICGGEVTQDVKADCVYGCGRVFHAGCYQAKRALGDADGCSVCGYRPA